MKPRSAGQLHVSCSTDSMGRLLAILLFFAPVTAYANGGGPLLLIVNGLAFLYGSIIIVLAEWGIYCWLAKVPTKAAFLDALLVNLYSTVVVGLAFPLLVAIVGGLGSMLPDPFGAVFSAAGTWIYEGIAYPGLAVGFTFFWLIVTYFLTVRYEAAVLAKRWKARELQPSISAQALSWRANSLTYGALLLFLLVAFAPGFFS